MSGGAFEYEEYKLKYLEEQIREEMHNKEFLRSLSPERKELVLEKFMEAVKLLKKAYVYVHRIDYFLCSDDGEESFLRRLEEDLKEERL